MTEETKPKRKRNPAWKDSPEQKAARQKSRYEKQSAKAKALGYSSWAALVTAILNDDVTIMKSANLTNESGESKNSQ